MGVARADVPALISRELPAGKHIGSDSVPNVIVHTEAAEAVDDVEDGVLERFLGDVPGQGDLE